MPLGVCIAPLGIGDDRRLYMWHLRSHGLHALDAGTSQKVATRAPVVSMQTSFTG